MFQRVALGISGGVDSAVAGALLKNKGLNVVGVFMRNWDTREEDGGGCSSDVDAEDARWVCRKLDIPFVQVDFVKEYWNHVFTYLLDSYEAGSTPNPDIYCNRFIKFDRFFHYAGLKLGADAIATGHYAKTSFGPYLQHYQPHTDVKLLQGRDRAKDQTFFLSQVTQPALRKTMFPLGDMTKKEVRQMARSEGLSRVATKSDSTGICFIGQKCFTEFLGQYIEDKPGNVYDIDTGAGVSQHRGLHHWTIGQRSGIPGYPWRYYVAKKDVESNAVFVARGVNHPSLFASSLLVSSFHWISNTPAALQQHPYKLECDFRFQHTKPLIKCVVCRLSEREMELLSLHSHSHSHSYAIHLRQPLRALTKGQFAVLYQGDECLGSASIVVVGPTLLDGLEKGEEKGEDKGEDKGDEEREGERDKEREMLQMTPLIC